LGIERMNVNYSPAKDARRVSFAEAMERLSAAGVSYRIDSEEEHWLWFGTRGSDLTAYVEDVTFVFAVCHFTEGDDPSVADTVDRVMRSIGFAADPGPESYGASFDEVLALLFRHDPMGINFDTNPDEYDCEARTILPRLADCRSEADVLAVLLREFHRWFGADIREDKANYREIAVELWELWCRRRQRIARELLKSDPECRKDG
jgi:hypothetical protein